MVHNSRIFILQFILTKSEIFVGLANADTASARLVASGVLERREILPAQAEDNSWAIDLVIYEYHLHRLHQAMVAAGERGVKVRILFHARRVTMRRWKMNICFTIRGPTPSFTGLRYRLVRLNRRARI
jgi:hypothetical protein